MTPAVPYTADLTQGNPVKDVDLNFQLPDPEDEKISEPEFKRQIEVAWQVCDRFDLQTDIWRGRILRTVRDRERQGGDGRGTGFLNWLKDREITKSQAYSLIELADSADALLQEGLLEPQDVNQFSKRAFVETAQSAPEVQQMVSDAARKGDHITRREVRQISDEWTAMTSELLPEEVREKAANNTIPTRYLAPLVREMEKLPELHQQTLKTEITINPDIETLKQVTSEARYLAKYLGAANQVQSISDGGVELETALEEALRVGCLSATADMVTQAAQLEQTAAKLYTTWKRLNKLAERVYVDSGESTPNLRSLLNALAPLTSEIVEIQLGDSDSPLSRTIRWRLLDDSGSDEGRL
ncbi:hypothetical protein [Pseudanabaena sp. FACHB-2040]|uniref:hypothetical protein n=1 Tax=Pseudanabaena sp. FACHB-2040 TaxID=2692859 RepID=UPI001684A5BB|nr:hypothetical protein [Pseudanabaena sp. FACHB-2040]MBD2257968.1 hypothetical protein [Pseudanabaena sp. FACHB-2040]